MWEPLTLRICLVRFRPSRLLSTSVTQGPAVFTKARAATVLEPTARPLAQLDLPKLAVSMCPHTGRPRHYLGAVLDGIHSVQDHQAGILDPAIGIDEGLGEIRDDGPARFVAPKIDRLRAPAASCGRPGGRRGRAQA